MKSYSMELPFILSWVNGCWRSISNHMTTHGLLVSYLLFSSFTKSSTARSKHQKIGGWIQNTSCQNVTMREEEKSSSDPNLSLISAHLPNASAGVQVGPTAHEVLGFTFIFVKMYKIFEFRWYEPSLQHYLNWNNVLLCQIHHVFLNGFQRVLSFKRVPCLSSGLGFTGTKRLETNAVDNGPYLDKILKYKTIYYQQKVLLCS